MLDRVVLSKGNVAFIASYEDGQTREVYLNKKDFLDMLDELKSENSVSCEGIDGSVKLNKEEDNITVEVLEKINNKTRCTQSTHNSTK